MPYKSFDCIIFNPPRFSEWTRLPGYFRRIQAMLAPRKAIGSSININGGTNRSHTRACSHTDRTSCRCIFREGLVNKFITHEYLLPFQEFQSSLLLIYFRDGPNRCSHYTKVWHRTYPICDAPLSRSARRSFRHRNHAATTTLVCEEKPCA